MSGTSQDPQAASGPPPGAPTVCLGEVLVDLICERPLEDMTQGQAFVPHFGGAVANVAVTAASHGAHVALAGGAGDDPWGRWLRDRLGRERVGLSLFELVPGVATPVAIVGVGPDGEPSYQIYGDSIATVVAALGGRAEAAIDTAAMPASRTRCWSAPRRQR